MKKQFSANRQASKISGIPYRFNKARVCLMFSIETGWPPPLLLVIVIMTSGMLSRPSRLIVSSSRTRSMLPLKGSVQCGS